MHIEHVTVRPKTNYASFVRWIECLTLRLNKMMLMGYYGVTTRVYTSLHLAHLGRATQWSPVVIDIEQDAV